MAAFRCRADKEMEAQPFRSYATQRPEDAAKAVEGKAESEKEGQICSVMIFALDNIELLRFTPAANPVD